MNVFYDFHIHSCLSPCGDDEMTPYNLVNMAKICGYDVIALTDHNTCLNCEAAIKVGNEIGLLVLPGMELTTSEEIHIVCLFSELQNALDFSEYVYEHLPDINNVPDIFGNQTVVNECDEETDTVEKLLISATDISIGDVKSLMDRFGGVCFPAHIDKSTFSIISNLGSFPDFYEFTAAELSPLGNEEEIKSNHTTVKELSILRNSDAHYLHQFCDPQYSIAIDGLSSDEIIKFIKTKKRA